METMKTTILTNQTKNKNTISVSEFYSSITQDGVEKPLLKLNFAKKITPIQFSKN